MFADQQFPFSLNMLISDPERVAGVQIMPGEIRPNFVKDVIVQANHYDYVDWQKYLRDPHYAADCYEQADRLLRQSYQAQPRVDNEQLLDILRAPLVCRQDDQKTASQTIAFMTRESFGLGNPHGPIGIIPI
jgi:hypothetical protein